MSIDSFPKDISVEDKYTPIKTIIAQDEADAYLERCIQHTMAWDFPVVAITRDEAERIERGNILYFSKSFDQETQDRIKKLFRFQ